MVMQNTIPTTELSFKDFLFKNRRNKIILYLTGAVIIIQFSIFKYLYPFASYIHGDSFSYIKAAYQNLDINTYPIGYSRFLRLFSVFTKSDTALVAFQYLFLQISALFLLFTTFYFYKTGKIIQYVLIGFMVLNPLFLHLSNLVSSDCLFVGLSLTWFALLLWILHRPSNKIIIWHAVILFLAFIVRYNAIVYPLISAVAFWISVLPLRKKIMGVLAGALLCGLFVGFTSYQYKKLTGYWQFSPFSGWLMTNNAMYAYRYVKSNERKHVQKKFQVLDHMIREYFDSTRDTKRFPIEAIQASTVYMWTPRLPMYKYRNNLFKNDTTISDFKKWATMGPFYEEYGMYLIRLYPWHFIRYYLWPNANKYYSPPVEFLEKYNSGSQKVSFETKSWFEYKSIEVRTRTKNKEIWVLSFYPILSGIFNLVMLCLLIFFVLLKGWKHQNLFSNAVFIGGLLWLINACFTIFVSSAALRFQSFPILITVVFVALLADWMYCLMDSLQRQENVKKAQEIRNPGGQIIVDTSLQ
jgi:hypothetical protein